MISAAVGIAALVLIASLKNIKIIIFACCLLLIGCFQKKRYYHYLCMFLLSTGCTSKISCNPEKMSYVSIYCKYIRFGHLLLIHLPLVYDFIIICMLSYNQLLTSHSAGLCCTEALFSLSAIPSANPKFRELFIFFVFVFVFVSCCAAAFICSHSLPFLL